jgi:hypothetical protein
MVGSILAWPMFGAKHVPIEPQTLHEMLGKQVIETYKRCGKAKTRNIKSIHATHGTLVLLHPLFVSVENNVTLVIQSCLAVLHSPHQHSELSTHDINHNMSINTTNNCCMHASCMQSRTIYSVYKQDGFIS